MPGAVHSSASVGVDSADYWSWFALVGRDLRQQLAAIAPGLHRRLTAREAGKALSEIGREERIAYQRFHDQLRAECDAGLVCGRPRA